MRFWVLMCGVFLALSCGLMVDRLSKGARAQNPINPIPTATPTPQNDGFRNVQVLEGVRDLLPTMHFIRASLGVRCDYCHVTEINKYYLDDKPAKRTAREMIVMTRQLNDAAFNGRPVITCNTCHRGSTQPVAVPQIATDFVNTTRREAFEPSAPTFPSPEEIVSRYEAVTHISSLGAARLRIDSRRAKIVNAGTSAARALPRAEQFISEAFVDGPRGATTSPLSNGQIARVGSNGKRLWLVSTSGPQWLGGLDNAQLLRKINPLLVCRVILSEYASVMVSGSERIVGIDAYILTAVRNDNSVETLWFSKRDGLLIRRTYFRPTLLGPEPEQYDLSAYKNYGGVKLPTSINTSYLDDQHLGVLKRLLDVKLKIPVTDNDFEPPER